MAPSFPRITGIRRTARLERGGEGMKRRREVFVSNGIQNRRASLRRLHHARAGQRHQVTRNGGQVEVATLRHFADGTGPAALGNAREQSPADGVAQRLEQVRHQALVQRPTAGARLTGRGRAPDGGRCLVACLHHDASLAAIVPTGVPDPPRDAAGLFPAHAGRLRRHATPRHGCPDRMMPHVRSSCAHQIGGGRTAGTDRERPRSTSRGHGHGHGPLQSRFGGSMLIMTREIGTHGLCIIHQR